MLRTAGIVAGHELRRLVADKAILVFGLGLPIVIITLVGLTFGGQGRIDVGVIDLDHSARSAALIGRLEHRDGVEVRVYRSERNLRRDVRTGDLQAGMLVPDGYGEAVDAGAAEVQALVDPTSPAVFTALATLDAGVTQEGVHEGAVALVAEAGEGASAARSKVLAAERSLAPVQVVDRIRLGREDAGGQFSYTAPSNLVLFVFINTFAVSTILATDRKTGVLRRQLSTPNTPGAVLFGIGASKLAFSVIQSALILLVGWLGFGVHWGDPLGVAALAVVFAALATAVGLLVGALADDADQAQSIGIPLGVATGMLGGCMWPLAIVPRAMQVVGHLSPHAWAMDAWQELIYDRAGIGAILPNLLVLLGATLVVGLVAVRALRRSVLG
jgi:ABC-2 type transport system permease protein